MSGIDVKLFDWSDKVLSAFKGFILGSLLFMSVEPRKSLVNEVKVEIT